MVWCHLLLCINLIISKLPISLSSYNPGRQKKSCWLYCHVCQVDTKVSRNWYWWYCPVDQNNSEISLSDIVLLARANEKKKLKKNHTGSIGLADRTTHILFFLLATVTLNSFFLLSSYRPGRQKNTLSAVLACRPKWQWNWSLLFCPVLACWPQRH